MAQQEERPRICYNVQSPLSNHGGRPSLLRLWWKSVSWKVWDAWSYTWNQLPSLFMDSNLLSMIIYINVLVDLQHNRRGACNSGPLHVVVGQGKRSGTQRDQREWVWVGLWEAGEGRQYYFRLNRLSSTRDGELKQSIACWKLNAWCRFIHLCFDSIHRHRKYCMRHGNDWDKQTSVTFCPRGTPNSITVKWAYQFCKQ